ncbi:MAG: hypothetical protein ACRD7E_22480 [Bryobacteraceae bacterium]
MLLVVMEGESHTPSGPSGAPGAGRDSWEARGLGNVPDLLRRFVLPTDRVISLSLGATGIDPQLLVERPGRGRPAQWLFASIGYVGQPKEGDHGFFVRAELPKVNAPKALFLSGACLRRYFYLLEEDAGKPETLYDILRTFESASPADLRLAWRLRSVELSVDRTGLRERAKVERAFNILAHPDLRNCYDRMRRDEHAPPLFPYGGFGSIFVAGRLSDDGEAFFADRILSYKPEMTTRKLSLLFRRCEFFADRVICLDPRRKVEVSLDGNLLPGVHWDLTWNQWKHWLKSRIGVEATLVHAGKYRLRQGEWILRQWFTALPSRIHVSLPADLAADVERAQAIHALLGEHADLVTRVRAELAKQPVEHTVIQHWFDQLDVSPHLKPHHITWMPDYEAYYFEQLRRRSRTWFLYRDEYLLVWSNVLIAEVPQQGHATYLFARPKSMEDFMKHYAGTTREDVRNNRDDLATRLGFIGRVVRGQRKKRWLHDVLKHAGEKADYVEAPD